MSYKIVKVAIPTPLHHFFDYVLPEKYFNQIKSLDQGMRIKVPFGRREVIGFIISIEDTTDIPKERLKPIIAVLDDEPLWSPSLLKLIIWTSQYYHYPLGEVMETALPARLRKIKVVAFRKTKVVKEESESGFLAQSDVIEPALNEEQQKAFNAVKKSLNRFEVFLLEGVTGSGKTEVYLQLIQQVLDQKKQVLLLVPEISLTPQMTTRLQQRLGDCIVRFHSGLTDVQRFHSWQMIRTGQKSVVIGTRSAVFTPFKNLGLIIIDEEHDSSFKQQTRLAYHARDVAIMRARLEHVPILLGSATPALETLWNAMQGRYHQLNLYKRAVGAALPKIEVMDLRGKRLKTGLSQNLLARMEKHLQAKGQVLLFLNRRGFSPIYLCHGCGWVIMCPECDSPLRFHQKPEKLRCHICETVLAVPSVCPDCHQDQLFPLGQGTQRLEASLASYFPEIKPIRIDADSTRGKNQLINLLTCIRPDKPSILIGTQILAKGHHFPGVTLAVVVDGDGGLFGTDFRSRERTAQLITQVGGRSGRGTQMGEVIIQTHHPQHSLWNQLIQEGYSGFSRLALQDRKQAMWPPFSYLALLRVEARSQAAGLQFLEEVKEHYVKDPAVILLGPVPSLLSKRAGYYRSQLLFQSKKRSRLHDVLHHLVYYLEKMPKRGIRYSLEVDPSEIC